jgi:hypothetical protein
MIRVGGGMRSPSGRCAVPVSAGAAVTEAARIAKFNVFIFFGFDFGPSRLLNRSFDQVNHTKVKKLCGRKGFL